MGARERVRVGVREFVCERERERRKQCVCACLLGEGERECVREGERE